MLFGRGEDAQSRSVGGFPSSLDVELFAQPTNKLRLVVHNWEHSAKEEQVARRYRLDVGAKRRGGGWELNPKVSNRRSALPCCEPFGLSTGARLQRLSSRLPYLPPVVCSKSLQRILALLV